ncbi:LuxR C-terminal-related transcriptional regulator [Treponema brennaborense]|uniref:Two component transcriptional regulator, LuxR family n=1 Tax=Treponema brennaborense (strain DSM 12168 / CIP 105900 / DD5/3) TaxID=906968 RepID=F4LPG4_TREBD|nr:response regulator transcription factor [Treponema brennaborense]AEE15975.1 two component transcriptional regulator, LuxR family [Treponema brennaborense DSM 12168]
MKTFLIIDDHVFLRHGLAQYLESSGSESDSAESGSAESDNSAWKCIGEAACLTEAETLLTGVLTAEPNGRDCTVILLDVMLQKDNGLEFIRWIADLLQENGMELRADDCPVKIVIYSAFVTVPRIQRALELGAKGCVSKIAPEQEILDALNAVAAGGTYIDSGLYEEYKKDAASPDILTKREREVLIYVQDYLSNQQIADKMNISTRTVENYLSRLYEKTDVFCRSDLIGL